MNFRDNMFSYIFVLLVILTGAISYFRFVVNRDYIIKYEGECDPETQTCFLGCEDDGCTKNYYYSKVQKYASDVERECGKDITDCKEANTCLPGDKKCSIVYCDSATNSECSQPFVKNNTLLKTNTENINI